LTSRSRASRLAPFLAAALAAALFGCAQAPKAPATPALFAVIPGSDGHVGAVVVHRDGASMVVDKAYGAARIEADGSTKAMRLDEGQVRRDFGSTLAALPGKPTSFTLYFLEGRDELTPESKTELDKVFNELKRRPLPDIMVIGHTDSVGTLAFNDRLSLARAERLREMMVALGIPASRIQAAGRGKRELLIRTDDNVAEARNRRVEINVR
jgi:outer membrane protein OmpA-like peptidoglycan-associated protein